MNRLLCLSLLLGLAVAGCGKKTKTATSNATNENTSGTKTATSQASNEYTSGNPITAPVDYLGVVNQARKYSTRTISTTYLQKTIQQFQAVEGHYPTSLHELITKHYYRQLPALPRGMVYQYNPQDGQVRAVQARRPPAPAGSNQAR